jgi:hypothetical protein
MELKNTEPNLNLIRVLNYIRFEFDGYPYEWDKDSKYFEKLLLEFPELDVEEELKQYHAWILDQPSWKKISYRSRFRQWLKRSIQFRSGRWRLYY